MEVDSSPPVKRNKDGKKVLKKKKAPQTYIVEKIMDKRVVHGRTEYFVKWMDYEESDNTWEPSSHFKECRQMIVDFEASISVENQDGSKDDRQDETTDDNGSEAGSSEDMEEVVDYEETSTKLTPKAVIFVQRDEQANQLFYTLAFNECEQIAMVEASVAHARFPNLVIEYLAGRIKWMKPPGSRSACLEQRG